MTKTFGQLSIHIVLIKFVLTSVHVDPEIVVISGQLIWQRKHFASYSHIYIYNTYIEKLHNIISTHVRTIVYFVYAKYICLKEVVLSII